MNLTKIRVFQKSLEVVSKPSIGLKVKADWDGQPQEYREYFEDWMSQSNTETVPERGFETTSTKMIMNETENPSWSRP